MLDAKTALPPSAGCASGRSGAVSVASLSAAPRSFSWGISASAVPLEGAIMPAAAQQRLFVSVAGSSEQSRQSYTTKLNELWAVACV